jgi:AcrR family transcriptional regulator
VDGEVSRDRILDAAERLLAKRGFSGTGISAISRESGLAASSIYWFFSSKQDLALNVIERAADRWIEAFGASGEASSLRGFFQRALEQTGSRLPDFVRLQVLMGLERGEQDPELLERFRRVRERVRPLLVPLIEQAIECPDAARRGELANDLARVAMSFAQGSLVHREMDPDGMRGSDEELAEDLEAAVLAVAERRLARRPS